MKNKSLYIAREGFTPAPKRGLTPTGVPRLHNPRLVRGFTLIEVLVALVLFSFVIAIAMGIFFNALRNQRSALALMAANDNAESALEQMAREMRTSNSFTLSSGATTFTLPSGITGGDSIDFINARGISVTYSFNATTGTIERQEAGSPNPLAITGSNVLVKRLNFILNDGTPPGTSLTRVTIALEVAPAQKNIQSISTNIQMTVSPR